MCREACSGAKFVFHQAALGSVPRSLAHPSATLDVNVTGTSSVFEAARDGGVERVVFASSSSVYGDSTELPKREGREGRPLSPYALSKRVNEATAEIFFRCFSLELVGLRYFNVYGPRQDPKGPYAAVIPRFMSACLSGLSPEIYGDGEQSRDFTSRPTPFTRTCSPRSPRARRTAGLSTSRPDGRPRSTSLRVRSGRRPGRPRSGPRPAPGGRRAPVPRRPDPRAGGAGLRSVAPDRIQPGRDLCVVSRMSTRKLRDSMTHRACCRRRFGTTKP